jgi:transcriptional regulator with XRE-family HTH domain
VSEEPLRKHPRLGSLLKSWRRQVRLTQQEVAEAVSSRRRREMTPNWYAKLENRRNAYPSDEDLEHILAVLGRTRWEADRALRGASAADIDELAGARSEPPQREPSWSAEVAFDSASVPPAASAAAGAPRMRSLAAGRYDPPAHSLDDELRTALRRFGLSDAAVEEALAYARSLRGRGG